MSRTHEPVAVDGEFGLDPAAEHTRAIVATGVFNCEEFTVEIEQGNSELFDIDEM